MNIAYNMDCMDAMRKMPDKCFDLAVVDPVYGDVTAGGLEKTMKRLTNKNYKELGFCAYIGAQNPFKTPLTIGELAGCLNVDYSPRKILEEILGRLAAYEDTGLTPEEISGLCSMSNRAKMADLLRLEEYQALGPIDHLRELAQAEKDGRLVLLLCRPDASAYQWKNGDDIPSLFRFDGVTINEDGEVTYQTYWGETFKPDDFGKTIFLTREEAEAAMKKREADNEAD